MNRRRLSEQFERSIARAWEELTDGWREMLSRSSSALTRFAGKGGRKDGGEEQPFPSWSVLAAECWETAQSVIVRVEVPGMKTEDLDVSIRGDTLHIRGEKRSEGEHSGRLYHVMERAYGRFERKVALPPNVDRKQAEVTYQSGVLTVILPKTETLPPQQLTVK